MKPAKKKKQKAPEKKPVLQDPLDAALSDTFPASDPPSLTEPHPHEPTTESSDRPPSQQEEPPAAPGP